MNILNIFIFICILVTGIEAVYWPCETNADCTAKYSSCSTDSGSCQCTDFDIVFSSDFTTCLKTSLIGDTCEDDVQCNLMPTGAKCKSGVCDCADGETYVRGRCRPLNGLSQHCDTDSDCYFGYDRESVQCKDNICTCSNGYYNRHGNICRRKSMEIGDACVIDTDCDNLGANVKCRSLRCQYVDEIKANVNKIHYNNNNNNIHLTTNTNNSNNDNINTRTKRQTSTPTESNSNFSKSSPTESEDFNVVPKLVNGLISTTSFETQRNIFNNNNTLSDTDPDDLNTASKDDISSATANKEAQTSREIAVQTSIEGYELKVFTPQVRNVGTITTTASTSSSSRRPSKQRRRATTRFHFDDDEKTISTVSNTDDDIEYQRHLQQQQIQYGFECPNNGESCTGLPHSICSNNVCLCRPGYYHKNGKCFAELGEIAESSDECENQYDPVTKKCICQKNFYYDFNLRGCRKPIHYNLSCVADNQCSPFGAAYCHTEIPRRCTCKQYAEYDELLQMCVDNQGLGSECETDDGCPIEHAICSNRICVCKENYLRKDDKCLPGIGAECLKDDECQAENSLCATTTASNGTQEQSKTCQCRKGFVHFKDECVKEAEDIEEACVDNEQCKPLLASCVENKCSCGEKQSFQNGRCENRKALNEVCTTASECFVEKGAENVECRNSVCQCKFGYRSDAEHRSCVGANKKNSSGRPSALKIITFMLIGSAFLITSAAIKQAYY